MGDAKAKGTTATTVAASQTDADVDNEWMDAIKNVFSHFGGGAQQSKDNEQAIKKSKRQVV